MTLGFSSNFGIDSGSNYVVVLNLIIDENRNMKPIKIAEYKAKRETVSTRCTELAIYMN